MAAATVLLAYGLAVGISLGLTGGGGSIITVPLLVYLVGVPVQVAIPTSLVIVGGTALAGFLARRSSTATRDGLIFGLVGIFGAIPGRTAALMFSGRMLLLLFSLIMLVAAYFMFRAKTYEARQQAEPSWVSIVLAGIGVGFLTGFLGVGGGFLIVPCLALIVGLPMRVAIPTSLLVIAINCASSLIGQAVATRHAAGAVVSSIDWHVAAIFLAGGLIGSWVGSGIAAKMNQRALKRVFAVFVFGVGLFIAASTTGLIPVSVK